MPETTNFTLRIDKKVRRDSEKILDALGMNLSTAVNIFLRQVIRKGGIPFEVVLDVPNAVTLAAMEEGERLAADPSVKGYTDVEELLAELRK